MTGRDPYNRHDQRAGRRSAPQSSYLQVGFGILRNTSYVVRLS